MGSVRRKGESIRVSLDRNEASLLVSLLSQVSAMLAGEPADDNAAEPGAAVPPAGGSVESLLASLGAPARAPEGPILQRLLPDAYRDDPEAAAEFRRLTDPELRAAKLKALSKVLDDLAGAGGLTAPKSLRLDLDADSAETWLYALNDIRLALGTHLEIHEEGDAERALQSAGEDRLGAFAIYDWLTWMQESIVRTLGGG